MQIVRVNCGDHACVTLFPPTLHHCRTWFEHAMQVHAGLGALDRDAVANAMKAIDVALAEVKPDPFTEAMEVLAPERSRRERRRPAASPAAALLPCLRPAGARSSASGDRAGGRKAREKAMAKVHGQPCWYELGTSKGSLGAAEKFYGEVLGWTRPGRRDGGVHYHLANSDGDMVAGLMEDAGRWAGCRRSG